MLRRVSDNIGGPSTANSLLPVPQSVFEAPAAGSASLLLLPWRASMGSHLQNDQVDRGVPAGSQIRACTAAGRGGSVAGDG